MLVFLDVDFKLHKENAAADAAGTSRLVEWTVSSPSRRRYTTLAVAGTLICPSESPARMRGTDVPVCLLLSMKFRTDIGEVRDSAEKRSFC